MFCRNWFFKPDSEGSKPRLANAASAAYVRATSLFRAIYPAHLLSPAKRCSDLRATFLRAASTRRSAAVQENCDGDAWKTNSRSVAEREMATATVLTVRSLIFVCATSKVNDRNAGTESPRPSWAAAVANKAATPSSSNAVRAARKLNASRWRWSRSASPKATAVPLPTLVHDTLAAKDRSSLPEATTAAKAWPPSSPTFVFATSKVKASNLVLASDATPAIAAQNALPTSVPAQLIFNFRRHGLSLTACAKRAPDTSPMRAPSMSKSSSQRAPKHPMPAARAATPASPNAAPWARKANLDSGAPASTRPRPNTETAPSSRPGARSMRSSKERRPLLSFNALAMAAPCTPVKGKPCVCNAPLSRRGFATKASATASKVSRPTDVLPNDSVNLRSARLSRNMRPSAFPDLPVMPVRAAMKLSVMSPVCCATASATARAVSSPAEVRDTSSTKCSNDRHRPSASAIATPSSSPTAGVLLMPKTRERSAGVAAAQPSPLKRRRMAAAVSAPNFDPGACKANVSNVAVRETACINATPQASPKRAV
mmetsp:Transcript_46489/g.133887  ORF Transcript_46489/g.133887 Transcript_46489/m.133887 type:complete len:542 (+) Transcript_46489:274-1899(+)